MLADAFAVDERSVGTVQIGNHVVAVDAANFRVMAGDFRVVELDRVGGVAPHPERRFGQLKAGSLIGSADDEQCRHDPDSPINSSILRIKAPY